MARPAPSRPGCWERRKFNVTVAVLLDEFCEFTALYVNVQPAVGQADVAGLVAVKEPSGFRRTVINVCAFDTKLAVIW